MDILLVLNKGSNKNMKVIVNLQTKSLREKVIELLEENRDREAFDLIVSKAEVKEYIPPGINPNMKPRITLEEDLL